MTPPTLSIYFDPGSSQWWTSVQVRDHRYPVAKLAWRVSGSGSAFQVAPRELYNMFIPPGGMGTGPYDFKLTDVYGQVVKIKTSKTVSGPRRDWLQAGDQYVKTASAREKIRQWFRRQERDENIAQGRQILERELKRLGVATCGNVGGRKIQARRFFSRMQSNVLLEGNKRLCAVASAQLRGTCKRIELGITALALKCRC